MAGGPTCFDSLVRHAVVQILTAAFVPQIRELVPESQAYMDLLAFERKLDQTIMRKRVDIQEALKRPMKVASLQFTHHPQGVTPTRGTFGIALVRLHSVRF